MSARIQANATRRTHASLPRFTFGVPARPPAGPAGRERSHARDTGRTLSREALLWSAPYLASLIANLAVGV